LYFYSNNYTKKKTVFVEVSKNLARDISENNLIELSKQLCKMLKLVARILKFLTALLITLEFPT